MCNACLEYLSNLMNTKYFSNNKLFKLFIKKFNIEFNDNIPLVNVSMEVLENAMDVNSIIKQNPVLKFLVRQSYYDFISRYVLSFVYNDYMSTTKTQFDIYSYSNIEANEKRNIEHIIPKSYFKCCISKQCTDFDNEPMNNNVLYYNPFIMSPCRELTNNLRQNFLFNNIDDSNIQFSISKNDILYRNICPTGQQQFPTSYQLLNSGKHNTILGKSDKVINKRNSELLGNICGYDKAKQCDTCFVEPNDNAKGDIARTMLYFYVIHWNFIRSNNCRNADGVRTKFLLLLQYLQTFVDWSNKYPVSTNEQNKNKNLLYATGTCNPFSNNTQVFQKEVMQHLFSISDAPNHEKIWKYLHTISITKECQDNTIYDDVLYSMINLHGKQRKLNIARAGVDTNTQPNIIQPSQNENVRLLLQTGGYYEKYLKYKQKYLQLKSHKNVLFDNII